MSTPVVIRYPLDPTGVNPNNLVVGEIQTMPARKIRAVCTDYGAFFAASLVVTDMATNAVLNNTQYYAAEMYSQPSAEFGAEICSIIMITDPTVSANVSLQYQALGGEYSTSQTAIIQQIYNLNLDDRPVTWPALIGKPSFFPPSAHLHDAGDIYGFEYVVNALDRIRAAILLGDAAALDAVYNYVDLATDAVAGNLSALQTAFNNHLADFGNPHKVNAAQVGAYTTQQSDANLAAVNTALQNQITANLNNLVSHENNTSNPHNTTAAQVGAWTIAQTQAAIAAAIATVTLGYTPVQQGGGAYQGTNKIYLGWDGSYPRIQVDSTDIGELATMNWANSQIANLQNQINGKAPTRGDYAYTDANQTVYFWDVHAAGTIFSSNDIWAFYSDERLKEKITTIKGALSKLHEILGVTYEHNVIAQVHAKSDRGVRHMGVLAGQVQKVAPEVVGPAPFDLDKDGNSISGENYLTVKYDKLVALAIEGIKELDLKVDGVIRALKRSGMGLNLPAMTPAYQVVEEAVDEELALA
jgi:hypothetical protein